MADLFDLNDLVDEFGRGYGRTTPRDMHARIKAMLDEVRVNLELGMIVRPFSTPMMCLSLYRVLRIGSLVTIQRIENPWKRPSTWGLGWLVPYVQRAPDWRQLLTDVIRTAPPAENT